MIGPLDIVHPLRGEPGDLVVAPDVRGSSATLVRARVRVRVLWQRDADDDAWHAELDSLVSPAVLSIIRARRLYTREP